jgi:hypothetical protein
MTSPKFQASAHQQLNFCDFVAVDHLFRLQIIPVALRIGALKFNISSTAIKMQKPNIHRVLRSSRIMFICKTMGQNIACLLPKVQHFKENNLHYPLHEEILRLQHMQSQSHSNKL